MRFIETESPACLARREKQGFSFLEYRMPEAVTDPAATSTIAPPAAGDPPPKTPPPPAGDPPPAEVTYTLKAPDGSPLDAKADVDRVVAFAKAHKLTNEQAQTLLTNVHETAAALVAR